MARQHAIPLLIGNQGLPATPLKPMSLFGGAAAVSEADIQDLIQAHPQCLPISEIDAMFVGAVSVCTELNTSAGPIDNLLITPSGLPVIVECKLWRNPEGRREVVGQILDYAKELTRWSSADLQREVNRRLKGHGNSILDLVRAAEPGVDEVQFNDALTANLRRGRVLLLIVGDGIREGVEAIAEYLQIHAGLQFSLGLVELPIYELPDGSRLVAPRVLARTAVVTRTVVALPDGYVVAEEEGAHGDAVDPEQQALGDAHRRFWEEFIAQLELDDPEQRRPNPTRESLVTLPLPAPGGSCWITVYRTKGQVGVFLNSSRNSPGRYAVNAIADDWDDVRERLGGTARLIEDKDGRRRIADSLDAGSLDQPEVRKRAFAWLSERANTFVNVLRPMVRSAVADYQSRDARAGIV